jgi:hypothetical protein
LFLDEPTTGLDPQTRARTWEVLRSLRRDFGTTLFLTTHYMDEAENCDRIAVIDHGKIVALDTPARSKQRVGKDTVTARSAEPETLARLLSEKYGITSTPAEGGLSFLVEEGDAFIVKLLTADRPALGGISVRRPTLDDVFLSLTGRQIRDEGAEGQFARTAGHRAEARMIEVIYALWRRDMLKFLRDRRSLITSMVRPFLWLVAFGFGLRASVKLPGADADFVSFLVPGMAAMTVLFSSMFAAISIVWEREFGFLKSCWSRRSRAARSSPRSWRRAARRRPSRRV